MFIKEKRSSELSRGLILMELPLQKGVLCTTRYMFALGPVVPRKKLAWKVLSSLRSLGHHKSRISLHHAGHDRNVRPVDRIRGRE